MGSRPVLNSGKAFIIHWQYMVYHTKMAGAWLFLGDSSQTILNTV
jgi:hypothetical protein